MSSRITLPETPIVDNPPQPTGSRDNSPDGVALKLADLVAQAAFEGAPRFSEWLTSIHAWNGPTKSRHCFENVQAGKPRLHESAIERRRHEDGPPPILGVRPIGIASGAFPGINWPGNWPQPQYTLGMGLLTELGIALNLSSRERAVLQRVCYRAGRHEDGRPPGCWESSASIGIALGFHRNHIGRALAALVDKGLLTATRRFSNSTIHRPTMAELSTGSPPWQPLQPTKRCKWMHRNGALTGRYNRKGYMLRVVSPLCY